jgi:hypothetical protein
LLTKVPAEIQLFVDVNKELFPYAGNLPGYKGEGTYTQIQSMLEEPVPHGPSKLVLSWGIREQDIYHFQWVDTFLDPAFVIERQHQLSMLIPSWFDTTLAMGKVISLVEMGPHVCRYILPGTE